MLYQIQQQRTGDLKDRILIAQAEPPKPVTAEFIHSWLDDVKSRHPLMDGRQWLICTEQSEYFFWAHIAVSALRVAGVAVGQETERKMIDSEYHSG